MDARTGERQARARDVSLFILGLVLAPFLTTGLFRLLPYSSPLWLPAVLLLALAVGLSRSTRTRPPGLGLGAGTLAIVVFLLWLFAEMGDGFSDM